MAKKYTRSEEGDAFVKMFENGITAGDKAKIIKARNFPKNTANNLELFKSYFLSGEGLTPIIKKLSEREIIVLHILSFNSWIADVSVFDAVYTPLPKQNGNRWRAYETFTKQYGAVLKAVQTLLVQKGLLVQYEYKFGGKSKTERMRFMFPSAFVKYLPPPFFNLKKLEGIGSYNEENSRKLLLAAIQPKTQKKAQVISLQNKKLYLGNVIFNLVELEKSKLSTWQLSSSAEILNHTYMDVTQGKTFSIFLLDQLKKMPKDKWFNTQSLSALLEVWDDTRKRKDLSSEEKSSSRYDLKQFCEAGWEAGILQKKKDKRISYYRLVEEATTAILPNEYMAVKEQDEVAINLKTIPFPDLAILSQIATFNPSTSSKATIDPDLVNIASISAETWNHPLIAWLKTNAPSFKEAFDYFEKQYGKELVHQNLLVAKVEDLSLRVLVEKELQKKHQVILLAENFIAFPREALGIVDKIVTKSGNVIKNVSA